MSLKLLEQLSLPGNAGKANEDSFAFLDRAALVLDGATPLGPPLLPGVSDAAWIAQFGARRIAAHLKDGGSPRTALRLALQDAEKSFIGLQRVPLREKWQTPCASLMMVAELGRERRGAEMEFLWFGDCTAFIAQDGEVVMVGDAIEKRKMEAARARRLMREKNLPPALGINRPEIEPMLRAARNRINSTGNWLFSPDGHAADHVAGRTLAVSEGAYLLLASDGFLALISDYDAYDAPGLMRACAQKGLEALAKELREIEQEDQTGERFSRFKTSDDATALLLQLI